MRGSELDPAVRAAIVSLRFGAGLEPQAIGALLKLESGTVRTTAHRIKKAAGSTDLLELLKHCRTKSRSGRPSLKSKSAAASAAAVAAAASAAAATGETREDGQEDADEGAQVVGEGSPLAPVVAENAGRAALAFADFEAPAWPERDLTPIDHNHGNNIPNQQQQQQTIVYHFRTPPKPAVDPALASAT